MDVVSHQRATEDEKRELLKLIKRMNDAENEDSGTYARNCPKRALCVSRAWCGTGEFFTSKVPILKRCLVQTIV
jgi:hypothetical protein